MTSAPIILVPGFWLGAWAWDEVAAALRADGHDVTALTLPGLESADADRSSITLADHVDAICEAVTAAGRPVVLAVHSGAGAPGYAVTDRIPEQIAAMSMSIPAPRRARSTPTSTLSRSRCPRGRSSRRRKTSTGASGHPRTLAQARLMPGDA
jgi:pimeloyl-ACP methyl ester carboxylesterase